MSERNHYVVNDIKGSLMTLEDAEKECERMAATSGSNGVHYVVKVVSAFRREPVTAKRVPCRFAGIE